VTIITFCIWQCIFCTESCVHSFVGFFVIWLIVNQNISWFKALNSIPSVYKLIQIVFMYNCVVVNGCFVGLVLLILFSGVSFLIQARCCNYLKYLLLYWLHQIHDNDMKTEVNYNHITHQISHMTVSVIFCLLFVHSLAFYNWWCKCDSNLII